MTRRIETQIAIRLKQYEGYRYEQYRDNGPGGQISLIKLNLETAKKQLRLYTKDAEATIVTREVIIEESDWEEIDTSETHELATILHKKQCHVNHVDQCSWDYENDWSAYTHKQYAKKAKAILEKTSLTAAKELLEIL